MIFQAGIVSKWTDDSQHFLLEHFDTIQDSPSHIYHSALPFSPSSSWLQKHYTRELSLTVKVVKGLSAEWGVCSRTVLLDDSIQTLSYHNNTVAAGSFSGDIIILDTITGIQTAILSGHAEAVYSVTFSSDGTSLVSGSGDYTVKLWDIQTGGIAKTFFGHTGSIMSVSMSADNTVIASGSGDKTIYLWSIQTGECHCIINQQNYIPQVSFSPIDSQHLISISGGKVWQWDTDGHQIRPTCNGSCIAFSSDGTQFISCYGTTIVVQNSNSGTIVSKFQVSTSIQCCCFSPDGRLIAIATGNTAYVWDITYSDPRPVETFIGHTGEISSLVFSSPSSLISASMDNLVKFWQIAPLTDPVITDLNSISPAPAPIQSITLQAKDGITITSDSDGVVKIWDTLTGLCKTSIQTPAKGTENRDIQLIGGRLILVWYADNKIKLWDAERGNFWEVDYESEYIIEDLRISGDGSKVFCLDFEFIQAWSIQTGELVGRVELEPDPNNRSLVVDDSRAWICSSYQEYQGWDFEIPNLLPVQLFEMPPQKLDPSGTLVWDSSLPSINDRTTGKIVFQLSRRFLKPVDLQWNEQYLVLCYLPKEVLVLDFSHLLL